MKEDGAGLGFSSLSLNVKGAFNAAVYASPRSLLSLSSLLSMSPFSHAVSLSLPSPSLAPSLGQSGPPSLPPSHSPSPSLAPSLPLFLSLAPSLSLSPKTYLRNSALRSSYATLRPRPPTNSVVRGILPSAPKMRRILGKKDVEMREIARRSSRAQQQQRPRTASTPTQRSFLPRFEADNRCSAGREETSRMFFRLLEPSRMF